MNQIKEKWTGKEFGVTLSFGLIYLVITLAVQMSGALSGFVWLFMPPLISVFAWLPYLYLTAREQKFGVALLLNLIVFIAYAIAGELSTLLVVTLAAAAVLAEITRKISGYDSFKGNLISYLFVAFSTIGSPLYVWTAHDYAIGECAEEMSPAYAQAVDGMSSLGVLAAVILATVVAALLTGLLSKTVFRRQYEKYQLTN